MCRTKVTYTPHGNGAQCPGALAGRNVYTGRLALHRLQHIVDRSGFDFFCTDTHNGPGHIISSLRTVTHYHHLVQLAALFDHRHTDGGTSLYGHTLVGIANKGKNERSIVIRHINSKAAAAIRTGRGLPLFPFPTKPSPRLALPLG